MALAYKWSGWWARPNQFEPAGDFLYWLVKAGRGFGKTRMGAEWVRAQVQHHERVALIGKDATDMRSVMIEGESGLLAICPKWERPNYQPTKRQLSWPNGAISELRTGEDPDGVRGFQCERLWCDEIAAWQYPQETWDNALLATRLGDDPRVCVTTTPKPIRLLRDLINDPQCVVTSGTTFDNLENLAPTFQTVISRYAGTRLERQEILAEMLDDEGLAYRWSERIHVVAPFAIPDEWNRFECMDYGLSAATAWYAIAVDFDGNLIVFDGLYEPGLPSEIAPKIKHLRASGWQVGARRNRVLADPAVFAGGKLTKWGRERAVSDEFSSHDVPLERADNDRRAGFVRISELLAAGGDRRFPAWHEFAGETGAPTLFVLDVPGTAQLREQLADAPLEEEGKPLPGEAVDRDWERSRGHGHASLRYGVVSWPRATEKPERPLDDPRAELLRQYVKRRDADDRSRPNYELV